MSIRKTKLGETNLWNVKKLIVIYKNAYFGNNYIEKIGDKLEWNLGYKKEIILCEEHWLKIYQLENLIVNGVLYDEPAKNNSCEIVFFYFYIKKHKFICIIHRIVSLNLELLS
ncbi:hypothetical protein [Spiroplasma endosymbiont of Seladonia tumulorum]|uniref:hypothetical protein n=1 Tax=Spiroplasma endosymbiont of Seladonia tumulorum TaxID=3066321 RepID=UPI0030CF7AA1